MRPKHLYRPIALGGAGLLPLLAGAALASSGRQGSYQADTARAMSIMDAGMMATPTGDVDHDFVQMMVPHHQGAIDMAVAELRYGHNEQLKRIAQEIIVDQQQEIAAMRLAIGQPLPPSTAAPTQPGQHVMDHAGMRAAGEK